MNNWKKVIVLQRSVQLRAFCERYGVHKTWRQDLLWRVYPLR